MIKVTSEVQSMVFPGGEVNINIFSSVIIEAALKSSDDVMELLLTVGALRRVNTNIKLDLVLKYFPYARQDRVCNPGEALSVEVFSSLVNSMKFERVEVWDIHNADSLALINNVVHISQSELLGKFPDTYDFLVAPDAGARKKLEGTGIIVAGKTRNPSTGEITGTVIKKNEKLIEGSNLLIVDDICDGGRTFIELAKVLLEKGAASVDLYVTHGIFSKGLTPLYEAGISSILTANNINNTGAYVIYP